MFLIRTDLYAAAWSTLNCSLSELPARQRARQRVRTDVTRRTSLGAAPVELPAVSAIAEVWADEE